MTAILKEENKIEAFKNQSYDIEKLGIAGEIACVKSLSVSTGLSKGRVKALLQAAKMVRFYLKRISFYYSYHIFTISLFSTVLFGSSLWCSILFISFPFLFLFFTFLLLFFSSSLLHIFSRPSSFHQFFTPLCSFILCFLLYECSEHS